MGKPFEKELERLSNTYSWALSVEITLLEEYIENLLKNNLLIVGSGGSFSSCSFAELLYQMSGGFAKAITPLNLLYADKILRNANLLFLSAGGRNKDIINAFNNSIEYEPKSIFSLCMREKTKLGLISKKYSVSETLELKLPSGKDGFLATNSLLAYFVVLARAFKVSLKEFPVSNMDIGIKNFIQKINQNATISVLFGGWGMPVAVDLESKFTEAALGNLHYADYRNFGHGRHHWFAKHSDNSAIVALVTPEEEAIAEKTLSLLPKNIHKVILKTECTGPSASIELLIKSFYFVNEIGKAKKIDPGRPGVPDYGSKLYHINYNSYYDKKKSKFKKDKEIAILRKASVNSLDDLTELEIEFWSKAYDSFIKKLNKAKFGAVVFDYDGTLCSGKKVERFGVPCKEIQSELIKLLEKNILIGIATGRGKSVRESFSKFIPKDFHDNVIIGFYNGGIIAPLSDLSAPDISPETAPELLEVMQVLKKDKYLAEKLSIEPRPKQLTIDILDKKININDIINVIVTANIPNIKVVESSHSLDIILKSVSKLNLVRYIENILSKGQKDILCIGDRGKWPGNDYELLSEQYSLSVDEVSKSTSNCWNIVDYSQKNIQATLISLQLINRSL